MWSDQTTIDTFKSRIIKVISYNTMRPVCLNYLVKIVLDKTSSMWHAHFISWFIFIPRSLTNLEDFSSILLFLSVTIVYSNPGFLGSKCITEHILKLNQFAFLKTNLPIHQYLIVNNHCEFPLFHTT